MRLLRRLPGNSDFELRSFNDELAPPYAILSHTWTDGQEVTYEDLLAGTGKNKRGYEKIRFCSERAAADGLEYFWIDTCCINKATIVELNSAINSMFRWYQSAAKCYAYLTDVSMPEEVTGRESFRTPWKEAFRNSRWFTRSWTLQELLAPRSVDFFSKEGTHLGSKASLEREIYFITGIPARALRGQDLAKFSVEERLGWAAGRTATLKEDKVYCLLGIFGLYLVPNYGEGEAYAMSRLRQEIETRPRYMSSYSSLPLPANQETPGMGTKPSSDHDAGLNPITETQENGTDVVPSGKNGDETALAKRAPEQSQSSTGLLGTITSMGILSSVANIYVSLRSKSRGLSSM